MYSFPNSRQRRNRKAQWSRDLTAETTLTHKDLIYPIFLQDNSDGETSLTSMQGILRYSIKKAAKHAKEAYKAGIRAVMLFPNTPDELRTEEGFESQNPDNLVCCAIRAIKDTCPEIGVIADVALDPYTNHGHDGLLDENGDVDNDETVYALCAQAAVLAEAGVDAVAPSDMMDGRVGMIRNMLEKSVMQHVQIISYAAKYTSQFYGPFRQAVGSSSRIKNGSKATYHMHNANIKEASVEAFMDVTEGADMLIIKPGMPYLDVLYSISQKFDVPVLAYQVSGEYSIIRLGLEHGVFSSYKDVLFETMYAFKRAGARAIITYAALDIAKFLNE